MNPTDRFIITADMKVKGNVKFMRVTQDLLEVQQVMEQLAGDSMFENETLNPVPK